MSEFEDDMISRPRLNARNASLAGLTNENERLREELAKARSALRETRHVLMRVRLTANNTREVCECLIVVEDAIKGASQ